MTTATLGGGFSNHLSPPSYQKSAVDSYLAHNKPPYPHKLYNATGRGVPDLSAAANNVVGAIETEVRTIR